jgi:Flp pilus assembly protein TadG
MKAATARGAVAVEFALVLPIFLLLVFAIIEFSLALLDKAVITNASREAARAGIVLKVPKLTATEIQAVATGYCAGSLITFGSTSAATVAVTGAQGNFGTPLSVTVTYNYGGLSFLLGPITLSATTVMKNE